jgi:hypothetical protein
MVQAVLDRHDWSVFRRVPADSVVSSSMAAARRQNLKRLVDDLQAGGWAVDRPPAAGETVGRREIYVWSQSQALAAILKCPDSSPEALSAAVRGIDAIFTPEYMTETDGIKQGWRTYGNPSASATVTLWTIIAVQSAVHRSGLLSGPKRQEMADRLQWAQEASRVYHPVADDGWNHFADMEEPTAHDIYSTVMALKALLEAREQRIEWEQKPGLRDALIESARAYLVAKFERGPKGSGWSADQRERGEILDGLTWEVYFLLLRAESATGGQVPPAIRDAMREQLIDLSRRGFEFPLAGSRFYRRHRSGTNGYVTEIVPVTFPWYPAAVGTASLWLERSSAWGEAPETRTRIRRSLAHLTVDLGPEMLADYAGGEPYRASELVYTYGTLGR